MQRICLGLGVLGLCLGLLGCKKTAQPPENSRKADNAGKNTARRAAASRPTTRPVVQRAKPKRKLARVPVKWIVKRVQEANQRLSKSAGGQLLWTAIHASGGLHTWYANGPLMFRFTYKPVSGKRVRDTVQMIDTWSSRAWHRLADNKKVMFGWDGERAWRSPKGAKIPYNVRFWALTPYYFVGIPFVLADKGVNLKYEGQDKFEGETYNLVRATFGADVGDAPRDFYVLYIHTKTSRVGGIRYVVSYPGYFPKGGRSPEKFMSYDGTQVVKGIKFPKTFRTFRWDGKEIGKLVTRSKLSEVSFHPKVLNSFFEAPKDAEILKGW